MAFNWDQYQQMPTTGGVTGSGSVDPSQLSLAPSVSFDPSQAAPSSPMQGGGGINPNGELATTTSPGVLPPNQYQQMGGGSGDPQAYFNSLFPGPSLSPQELMAHEADLKAHGITLIKNAAGLPSKIQLPDGSVVDPIIGAGSGQNQKAWNVIAGPGGAPTGGGPLSGSGMGSLGYNFGASMAPWNTPYTPLSAEGALNTPGLEFGLSEANRMMQNSAAAKGTLLNGRFQQALAASNIGNALQGYGQAEDRNMNQYLLARENFYNNEDRPFNKNLSLAQLGKPA